MLLAVIYYYWGTAAEYLQQGRNHRRIHCSFYRSCSPRQRIWHRIKFGTFKIGSGRSGNADGLTNSKEHAPEVGSQRVPALISASAEELW